MLRLQIQNVLPGMQLAQPVVHPERAGSTLLNESHQLTEKTVAHLNKLEIPALWIKHPSFKVIDRFVQPGVHHIHDELRAQADVVLESLANANDGSWKKNKPAQEIIHRLVLELATLRDAPTYKDDPPFANQSWHAIHAASTCYLTALLAFDLHAYIQRERRKASATPQQEIMHLCLGAFLHDIGLRKLPDQAFQQWIKASDEDNKRWQSHVKLGYDLARPHLESSAATVIMHHHQYYDRTGFPNRLNWEGKTESLGGPELHIFARIAVAADQFDELKNQPDGTIWPNVRALRYLLKRNTWSKIDPRIGRALLQVIPAYQPGSRVKLSNGDHGFVIDWKPASPCRPTVAIINDLSQLIYDHEAENPYDEKLIEEATNLRSQYAWADQPESDAAPVWPFPVINLARTNEISIIENEGHDVSQDNFVLPFEIRPCHRTGSEFSPQEAA